MTWLATIQSVYIQQYALVMFNRKHTNNVSLILIRFLYITLLYVYASALHAEFVRYSILRPLVFSLFPLGLFIENTNDHTAYEEIVTLAAAAATATTTVTNSKRIV